MERAAEIRRILKVRGQYGCEWNLRRQSGRSNHRRDYADDGGAARQQRATGGLARLDRAQRGRGGVRESEERFQAFMNNSPVVAFIKDDQGRILYMNDVMEEKFQVSLDELYGKTDHEWLPADVADAVWAVDQEVLATGRPQQPHRIGAHADGAAANGSS